MLQWIYGQRKGNLKPISQLPLIVSKVKLTQVSITQKMFNYGT
jgi:hypothetical protein